MQPDIDNAVGALNAIPATIEHDTRAKVGMAFKDACGQFDDYDAWQATNPRYDAAEVRSMWNSYTEGPVKAGTLFKIAAEYGWHGGKPQRKAPAKPQAKPSQAPAKPPKGMSPADVFQRFELATNQHGYVSAKGAQGAPMDALRVVPAGDSLKIAGESMAGYLAVPAYAADGTLQSLQFIPSAGGKKLNLPGASMAGASFTVGELVPGAVVYIVEGVGAAWSCWQATGSAAVACFGSGNMRKVAKELRQRDATAKLVLVPDVGKESDADRIAAEIGAAVARMPEGEPSNFDANDYALRDERDALQMLLEGATEPPKPPPLLKPVSVGDVLTHPSTPPAFIWDGYLPRGEAALFGAHGGTGKSTIALMLGVCAALGRPLFGIGTIPCKVVFASLEDGAGIVRHRLAGICRGWSIDPLQLQGRLHIVDGTEHPELFSAETRGSGETTASYTELCKLVQSEGADLVLIDNASDAFGGDEIQRRQVRAFMRTLKMMARLTDCAVLLLAHVDKSTSRNRTAAGGEAYSGSTAWHNSARSRLFLTRAEDDTLTLEHQKSNFGKLCEPLTLQWLDGGLPQLVAADSGNAFGEAMQQGRADDERAAALLRLIAEFESREQYCSPVATARNNVFATLNSEPAFKKLDLNKESTKRIVNQCQRAKWIEPTGYQKIDRKRGERWTLTAAGRTVAGLSAASAACSRLVEQTAQTAEHAASAACSQGGVGGMEHAASEVPHD